MTDEVNVIAEFGRTLYLFKGRKYDERSAHHNGIIGQGAALRKAIQKDSKRDKKKAR